MSFCKNQEHCIIDSGFKGNPMHHILLSIKIFIKDTDTVFNINTIIFYFNKLIYLFMAALGHRCCTRAFSSCGEQGLLLVTVCMLLIAVASLVAEHGL